VKDYIFAAYLGGRKPGKRQRGKLRGPPLDSYVTVGQTSGEDCEAT